MVSTVASGTHPLLGHQGRCYDAQHCRRERAESYLANNLQFGCHGLRHGRSIDRHRGGKPLIVASMFGNTTACVNEAKAILEDAGYEVLVASRHGSGGKAMESLIESGMVSGVLDVTTTEWGDEDRSDLVRRTHSHDGGCAKHQRLLLPVVWSELRGPRNRANRI